MEIVSRPDLLMWRLRGGPASRGRWANRVSFLRSSSDGVEKVIDEALAFLSGTRFTWLVGPTSQPRDLTQRLHDRGLIDGGDGNLLSARLPLIGLRTAPQLRIVEVEQPETARLTVEITNSGATAAERAAMVSDRLEQVRRSGGQLGYLLGLVDDTPVATASYRYSSDGQTVYLSGAETVPAFRGRGIYQSLVAYRLAAAERRGCVYAAIRAQRDSSMPILMRRGFVDHGHLPIFEPPAATSGARHPSDAEVAITSGPTTGQPTCS